MRSSLTSTSQIFAAIPSAQSISVKSFTAAGCDGQSATYNTSTFIAALRSAGISLLQDGTMRRAFAQLFVATAQRQAELALELSEVFALLFHIHELCQETPAHRRARLEAIAPQAQEAPNFAEFESQALHPAYESQGLNVVFVVLAEASEGSGGSRQQGIAFVEANRVDAHADFLGDEANLHG
jgi:hypothetical protein